MKAAEVRHLITDLASACSVPATRGVAGVDDVGRFRDDVERWFSAHVAAFGEGEQGIFQRLEVLLSLPGAEAGAAVVPLLHALSGAAAGVAPLPTMGWPFPIQSALGRIFRPDWQLHHHVTAFEAFAHLHFVTLASQFYWAAELQDEPTESGRRAFSAIFDALTDRACSGGRAWLERAAVLSVACRELEAAAIPLPFPDLASVMEPSELEFHEAKGVAGHPVWSVSRGGPAWKVLRLTTTLRNHLFGHWEALDDAARSSLGDGLGMLMDVVGHLFGRYLELRLALVSETPDDAGERHPSIHGYWDSEQFLGISNPNTLRRVRALWNGTPPAALAGTCPAPPAPRTDRSWHESLVLFAPDAPYERSLYLMPFGFGYAHARTRSPVPLPGLVDSVRWQRDRVRSIVQRTYTGALPREGTKEHWQDSLDDDEIATELHPISFVERVTLGLRRYGFSIPQHALAWSELQPRFDLDHDREARRIAAESMHREGEVARVLAALLQGPEQVTLLEGASGSGKTVLMAQLRERLADECVYLSFDHAIAGPRGAAPPDAEPGAAPGGAAESTEAVAIRMHFLACICRVAGVEAPAAALCAADVGERVRVVLDALAREGNRRVFVLVDALDQAIAPHLVMAPWPTPLPPNLHILCSSQPQEPVRQAVSAYGRRKVRLIDMAAMAADEVRALCAHRLGPGAPAMPEDVLAALTVVSAGLPIVIEFWVERLRPLLESGDLATARSELASRGAELLPLSLARRLEQVAATFEPRSLTEAVLWVLSLVPRAATTREVDAAVAALRKTAAFGCPPVSPRQVEDCLWALGGFLRSGTSRGETTFRLEHAMLGAWFVRQHGTEATTPRYRLALASFGVPQLTSASTHAEIEWWMRKVEAEDDDYGNLDDLAQASLLEVLRTAFPQATDAGAIARARLCALVSGSLDDEARARGLVPEVRAIAEDTARSPWVRAEALLALGIHEDAFGTMNGAEHCYAAAIDACDGVRVEDSPLAARCLARALRAYGDDRDSRGDYEGALELFRRALEIARRLVELDPCGAHLRELARALADLRSTCESQGHLPEAREYARQVVAVRQRLAAASSRVDEQLTYLRALESLADLSGLPDDSSETAASRRHLLERLARAEREAEAAADLHSLARVLLRTSTLLIEDGRPGEAVMAAERAVACRERLLSREPSASARDLLSLSLYRLAGARLEAGDARGALETAEREASLCEELLREGDTVGRRNRLAETLGQLASIHEKLGSRDRALDCARRKVSLCEGLLEQEPGDINWMAGLSAALRDLAYVHAGLGDHQGSVQANLRSLELRSRIAALTPTPDAFARVANAHSRIAGQYIKLECWSEAREHAESGARLREQIASGGSIPDNQEELVLIVTRLGTIAVADRGGDAAGELFAQATDLAEQLVRDTPSSRAHRISRFLAMASAAAVSRDPTWCDARLAEAAAELARLRAERPSSESLESAIERLQDLATVLERTGASDAALRLRAVL